jgi:FimV-like protein
MAVSTPEATATMPAMVDEGQAAAASDPYADILGEADIHIAYGLYDEAARLLQEPLAKSGDRKDLHLKLLEVYFSANMAKEFEAQAAKMRQVVSGTGDPDWEKVCIMGRQLCPDSTLFAGTGAGGEGITPTADLDITSMLAGAQAQGTPAAPPSPPPAAEPSPAAGTLDLDLSGFDLGVGADSGKPAVAEPHKAAPAGPAPAAADVGNALDFNLEDFKLNTPAEAAPASTQAATTPTDTGLDIDLSDFDVGAPESPAASEPAKPAEDAGGELAIDDLLSPELGAGEGQADTRLDLARAYMDMGEPAMAQSLLQEVIAQGNAIQKQEAKELLGRLGPA